MIYSLILLAILATNSVTIYDPFPTLNVSNLQQIQNLPHSHPLIEVEYTGYPIFTFETIQNPTGQNVSFTFVYEVVDDQTGYVSLINSSRYEVSSLGKVDVTGNYWIAQQPGNYTFKTFVVSDPDSPQILAESKSVTERFVCDRPSCQ